MTLLNPRRREITIAAIAASLVTIVGGTFAFAHNGGGHIHGHLSAGGAAHHLEHMQALLNRVGATDAQKAQIEGILKPAMNEMKTAHEAHFAAYKQFHDAISAPSIDRARLESLRAEQVKSLDEASKRLVVALSDAAELLSPDQRAALAKDISRHHGS